MAINQTGGYNIEFVQKLDEKYKCLICSFALRSPFQTNCGHRFCESCIKPIIESGPKTCPVDNSPLKQIFRDAFCNREILELECYCSCKSLGCEWAGQLRNMEEHQSECLFVDLDCPNDGCDVKTQRQLLQKHLTQDCRFKRKPCQYCGVETQELLMEKHQDEECSKIKLPCPNQCGVNVAREDMESHIAQDCANVEATCPFIFGACAFQGSRASLKKHLMEKIVDHSYMTKEQVTTFQSQIEVLQDKTASLEQQHQQCLVRLANQDGLLVPLRDDLETLRGTSDSQEKKIRVLTQVEGRPSSSASDKEEGAAKPDTTDVDNLKINLKKIEDQVGKLLIKDRQVLHSSVQVPTAGQSGSSEETVALERRVSRMEHQQTLSDVQMAEHDNKIQMLEITSYDGAFSWKIEEVGRRVNEAITGKTLSIYSSPFYVGRFGYKVCSRVYLNGDGMGKDTHLSLFFVVMRGEYDALLPWPFQQKVSFKLIDQSEDHHIVDSFRPDPNSSSFQRPTSNMNIASGCPLFVPKAVFQSRGYIKDDTLFFKVSVDATGIPSF